MECEKVQEQLPAYLDASLGWLMRRRVAAHLQTCATCRHEHHALVRTVELVREAGSERIPRDVTSQVMARLALEPAAAPRWHFARPLLLAPAALAAAVVLALQLGLPNRQPAETPAARASVPNVTYVHEYALSRGSQEIGGSAGTALLASELTSDSE